MMFFPPTPPPPAVPRPGASRDGNSRWLEQRGAALQLVAALQRDAWDALKTAHRVELGAREGRHNGRPHDRLLTVELLASSVAGSQMAVIDELVRLHTILQHMEEPTPVHGPVPSAADQAGDEVDNPAGGAGRFDTEPDHDELENRQALDNVEHLLAALSGVEDEVEVRIRFGPVRGPSGRRSVTVSANGETVLQGRMRPPRRVEDDQ